MDGSDWMDDGPASVTVKLVDLAATKGVFGLEKI